MVSKQFAAIRSSRIVEMQRMLVRQRLLTLQNRRDMGLRNGTSKGEHNNYNKRH